MAEESIWLSEKNFKECLEKLVDIVSPDEVSLKQLIEKSNDFPRKFPIHTSRNDVLLKVCFNEFSFYLIKYFIISN